MSEQIDSLYSFIINNREELEHQIYKLKDEMEEHSDYLKDILKTTNEILDTIEDKADEYKEYHNSLKDPQYLYKNCMNTMYKTIQRNKLKNYRLCVESIVMIVDWLY